MRLLGIQTGEFEQLLAVDFSAEENHVVAISSVDGSVSEGASDERTLRLHGLGQAHLAGNMVPAGEDVMLLRFEPLMASLAGPRPVLHRFALRGNGWFVDGLPPGNYRVTDERGRTRQVLIESYVDTSIR